MSGVERRICGETAELGCHYRAQQEYRSECCKNYRHHAHGPGIRSFRSQETRVRVQMSEVLRWTAGSNITSEVERGHSRNKAPSSEDIPDWALGPGATNRRCSASAADRMGPSPTICSSALPRRRRHLARCLQSSRPDVVPPQTPSPTFPTALKNRAATRAKTTYSQGPVYFAAEYEDERGKLKEIQCSDHARETVHNSSHNWRNWRDKVKTRQRAPTM